MYYDVILLCEVEAEACMFFARSIHFIEEAMCSLFCRGFLIHRSLLEGYKFRILMNKLFE
jgi:hypothetical protein